MSIVVIILGGALLSACQPIPQSYYDWLAAGGGYYDGYAPLFHGHFINECRLPNADPPRDCRIDAGRIGSSGIGSSHLGPFGHSLALSFVLGTRLRHDQRERRSRERDERARHLPY